MLRNLRAYGLLYSLRMNPDTRHMLEMFFMEHISVVAWISMLPHACPLRAVRNCSGLLDIKVDAFLPSSPPQTKAPLGREELRNLVKISENTMRKKIVSPAIPACYQKVKKSL